MNRLWILFFVLLMAFPLTSVSAQDATPTVAPPIIHAEDYLALPENALGPQIDPEKGYLVEEIRGGVYWITEGIYQMMFLTTGEGVIVVDAPLTIGDKILLAIADVTDEPITHVIYSHSHIDHIGAAHLYPDDAVIIAQEETAAQLERAADPNRPLPTVTFDESYELAVGSQTLQLDYPGNNHEPGNIIIYAPEQQVLMMVDVIFPGWMPWRRLAVSEGIPGYFNAVDRILEYDWDVMVAGHVTRLGTREDVELQREFLQDLRAAALEGLQTVQVNDVVQGMNQDDLNNPWAIFDGYIDGVVQHCVDTLYPQWNERLGGVDVFLYDQCMTMEQSLRID
jgi:glyoxylase-like metal-dependent hydrolase (beta-lactamase superfamily II)